MSVDNKHSEYTQNLKLWQKIRDCDDGAYAVKSRTKGGKAGTLYAEKGTAYLPPPNPTDVSADNTERYQEYLERASFVNFTGHTKEGMLGMVFRKETEVNLPTAIDYLNENANGGGLSLDQMIKDTAGEVLLVGRYGLLVDYPPAAENLTTAQVRALNLRANILSYEAESVVNWRCETIGGIKMLTMVVLQEPVEKVSDDGFEMESVMYHRVLRLKEGIYVQNLYDEDGNQITWETGVNDQDGLPVMNGDIMPRNSTGGAWNEIPFIFVGSINNDATTDKAPLYDIAEINIAHYRNSADYEESSFMVGQPTPALAGLTQSWVKENMGDGVKFGSRSAILLPEGGSASLLQAGENQMPLKGMEIKEEQMIKLGARLIQEQGGVETAEAAKIRFAGQNSKLGSIIINIEEAYTKCLEWAGMFMGGTGEIEIEVNKQFYDSTIDPQTIMAQIQLMDRGVIAQTDIRDNLRKASLIGSERTDLEIDSEAEIIDIL